MRLNTRGTLASAGLFVLAVTSASLAFADTDDDWCRDDGWGRHSRPQHCEVRESTFRPGSALTVDARPNGGISVRSTDASEVRLLAKVVATADSEEDARSLARAVQIESGATVRAVGPATHGRRDGFWVSYRLEVPHGVRLDLRADNGGISLRDFSGTVRLHTVNGGLHLSRAGGDVQGDTVNGGVHVDLSGTEWQGQGLDLRTTNGGLHVSVPADYNARLEMGTVNGGVHSDIPLSVKRSHHRRIDADLGHGGPLVRIETTNGGIHLEQH
jgi:hypothetical protein